MDIRVVGKRLETPEMRGTAIKRGIGSERAVHTAVRMHILDLADTLLHEGSDT